MHKITSSPITIENFELDDYCNLPIFVNNKPELSENVEDFVNVLEDLRQKSIDANKIANNPELSQEEKSRYRELAKAYWKELIRWLPSSWLQTRTVTMNYEVIYSMCEQRKNHKLNEWSGKENAFLPNFLTMAKQLPYAQELIFSEK